MKSFAYHIAVVSFVLSGSLAQAGEQADVGYRTLTAASLQRGKPIEITIWYPAKPEGEIKMVGASKVFEGVPARQAASPADGRFRIVVLSHGGMRANQAMSGWIAANLAARGNVVVVPHPPVLHDGDATAAVDEVWLRPGDLSTALDAVASDTALSRHADPQRIAAVGFFLGGTSALAVAGARLDAERYKRSCDIPGAGPDCRWFAKNGVDLHKADGGKIATSHTDPRVKAAIAIAPEMSADFTPESLAAITIPVEVIALGELSVDMSELVKLIPGAGIAAIADATPFSAFSPCTPQALKTLAAEGEDDTICREAGMRTREQIQAEIASRIGEALISSSK